MSSHVSVPSSASTSVPTAASTIATAPATGTDHSIDLRRGALPILLVSTLWGLGGLVSTLAPAGASTSALAAAGMLLGGGLMLVRTPSARRLLLTRDRRERLLLTLGTATVLAYQQFFYPAVREIGVAEATVIALGSAPLFAGLLTRAVDRRPLPARWLYCAPFAVVGCALLIAGHGSGAGLGPGPHSQPLGVALALIPGLAYAGTSIVAARLITAGNHSAGVMGAMFGGAAVLSAPILAVTGVGWLADAHGLGSALFLGLVSNFFCYTLFGRALRHTSAAVATTLTLTEGAVGTLMGVAVRGERLAPIAWAGLALLGAALFVLCVPIRSFRSRPVRDPAGAEAAQDAACERRQARTRAKG
jgi:drug/metabolite transporter, DME family